MSDEEFKQAALNAAEKNGRALKRLPSGRWQGVFPGPTFDTRTIQALLKEGKIVASKTSEKWEHRNGGVIEEVSLV